MFNLRESLSLAFLSAVPARGCCTARARGQHYNKNAFFKKEMLPNLTQRFQQLRTSSPSGAVAITQASTIKLIIVLF